MVAVVLAAPERPPAANQPLAALAINNLEGEPVAFLLTSVKSQAADSYAGDCVVLLPRQGPPSSAGELGGLISKLNAAGEHPCRLVFTRDKTELIVTGKAPRSAHRPPRLRPRLLLGRARRLPPQARPRGAPQK